MKADTAYNNIFMLRAFALGPAEVRSDFGEALSAAEKKIQPDTSAPTNRIAVGSWLSLKSVGRREYRNVIGTDLQWIKNLEWIG